MWPFRRNKQVRRKRRRTRDVWKSSAKVLSFSDKDALTLETAFGNVFICGAPGSSKTTASGAAILDGLLNLKSGGLVTSVKSDEVPRIIKACRRAGRLKDVLLFDPSEGHNFLESEIERNGAGGGQIENVVDRLSVGCEMVDRFQAQRGGGRDESPFFQRARMS